MSELISAEKTGLKTAVANTVRPDEPVPGSGAAEQLPLLPLSQVCTDENATEQSPAGRGRGRPAGAINRSTKEWTSFILSRYQSPLIALAETYSRAISDLAEELGYLKRDANGLIVRSPKAEELESCLKIQLQCAKELAPYVHQKQPIALDTGGKGLMQLFISTGVTEKQVENAGSMPLQFLDAQIIENQPLSEEEIDNSDAGNSDAKENEESNQQDSRMGATD